MPTAQGFVCVRVCVNWIGSHDICASLNEL